MRFSRRSNQLLVFISLTLHRLTLKDAVALDAMSLESESRTSWLIKESSFLVPPAQV